MPVRVFICPIVGAGTRQNPYRSKAADYGLQSISFLPSRTDGTPASPWALSVVRAAAAEFAAIAADATCDDLFAGDLPVGVQTRDDLVAFLRGRTVADVPAARRNAITAVLDKYAIQRSDVTGATPLWKVMQRVASTVLERDDNFAGGFGFGDE